MHTNIFGLTFIGESDNKYILCDVSGQMQIKI